MHVNVNKAYRARLCRLAGIDASQFDKYYPKALAKLQCKPGDIAQLAKAVKLMATRDKLKPEK